MLKLITAIAFSLTLAACTTTTMSNETNKLIGTAVNSVLTPTASTEGTVSVLKQCAALQARVLACQSLAQGADICVAAAKAQSPVADQCVL